MTRNEGREQKDIGDLAKAYQAAAPYLNIVYIIIASMALFGGLGWWMDSIFLTKPVFVVTGIFAGLLIGFYNFFRTLKELEKNEE